MGRWKSTIRELSAEARLHFYARSLKLKRNRSSLHLAAICSAFALIAAAVLGSLSVRPF
jgi:hypothetical protein